MKKYKNRIAFKSISGLVLLLIVFSTIINFIGYREFTKAISKQYKDGAFKTADTAGLEIDPNRMDAYVKSKGNTIEYQETWKALDKLCNAQGATFIYVIQPDLKDYAHITFVFSTVNKNYDYSLYEFGYIRKTTNDEYKRAYKRLYEGKSKQELVVRDKGYIETDPHITAMIPLKDSSGKTTAILCVQRQMDTLVDARHTYVKKVLLALIVIALLVIIGQGIYLHKVLLTPVKLITKEASRFAEKNVLNKQKLTDLIHNSDEIGMLASSIDKMEEQVQNYIENIMSITAERERIGTELSVATQIQTGMLPNIFPPFPDRTEIDLFATMTPAKEVGGDFYDFFMVDENHLCMVMADVSGKGVPAALFMMASKILLKNNAMLNKSPASILESANNTICSNNMVEMFVTVWIGILEISTGKVTAANAGHEYPVVMKTGEKFEIIKDKHGFVVGGMEGIHYKDYEFFMEPGSKLFLYTDGVTEATNAEKELFGMERMIRALNTDLEGDSKKTLENVKDAIDVFVKDAEQFDDITMLCLEYRGTQEM